MQRKMIRIMELVWLAIALFGLGGCIYFGIIKDIEQMQMFFLLTIGAGAFYAIRRRMRKRMDGQMPK